MKRLFYRPLSDLDDLRRLETKVSGTRTRFRRFVRLALALAAFFLFIELVVVEPGEEERPGFIMGLILVAVTSIYAVRALYTRPRILAAQRLLFQHRGLLFEDGRPAGILGQDAKTILARLDARIAALPLPRHDLRDAFDRAESTLRSALAELERLEETAWSDARAAGERHRAVLEAFRAAIARIEIDASLRGGFADDAGEALDHAAEILQRSLT